jgi:hypothetical protein
VAGHEAETPLAGGWVTSGVRRVGDTVRRPQGPNAPFVHRLLDHLEENAFVAAPRFLGIDDQGREILSFIAGEVPSDCRSTIWEDHQLVAVAALLRRFHDATSATELASGTEVVCHNDFGPWNLVWRDSLPRGVIDFDNAAPGARLDDLGYAIWKHTNIGLVELSPSEQRRRLRLMTTAYGATADSDVLAAINSAQARMRLVIEAAPAGPRRDEALSQNGREREWLHVNGPMLLD